VSELAVELGEHIEALDANRLSAGRAAPSPSTRWQFRAERPTCQLIAPAGSSA
jgi:hypothetical protein